MPADPGTPLDSTQWAQRADGLILPSARAESEPPPERPDLGSRIERLATQVGAVAATVGGLVIVVHLLGGTVMWLRFRTAGLPPDHAVALLSRQQMLIVGTRLIVLPMLATGLLAF